MGQIWLRVFIFSDIVMAYALRSPHVQTVHAAIYHSLRGCDVLRARGGTGADALPELSIPAAARLPHRAALVLAAVRLVQKTRPLGLSVRCAVHRVLFALFLF